MIRLVRYTLLLALLLPLSTALHAQAAPAAGVDGTVLDPDSKAVVNAAVVIQASSHHAPVGVSAASKPSCSALRAI